MASILSILGVARDAMLAQTAGLDVTGQNIANVSTPGYVRRRAILEARSNRGGPEGGVYFRGIQRTFDRFAQARVVSESGLRGAARARAGALSALQSIVAPDGGPNIGDRVNALFGAFNQLALKPDDPTARAAVLAKADDLAAAFHDTAAQLGNAKGELFQSAVATGGEINERLTEIAELNQKIGEATAQGDPAADLRDQRDKLIGEVGDRMQVQAVEDASGKMTLLSSGSVLVEGDQASSVQVGLAQSGALQISIARPGGAVVDVTAKVTSGTLGGLREARDVDLPALQQNLDQLAYDLAGAVNGVHAAGVGLDGVGGRPLFAPPAAVQGAAYGFAVDPSVAGQPSHLAAAKTAANLPGGNDVALQLAQLAGQPLGAGGTPSERFASLCGELGAEQLGAEQDLALRDGTVAQAEALRDSASGVSLDEEMVELTRYQRAFEASMKVLRTADELLAGLIRDLG